MPCEIVTVLPLTHAFEAKPSSLKTNSNYKIKRQHAYQNLYCIDIISLS
jgi:hypothetical protein